MSKVVPEKPIYLINFEEYLKPRDPHKSRPLQCFEKPVKQKSKYYKLYKRLKLLRWLRTIQLKVSKWLKKLPLPGFLSFLRERNDDGLCKPKTGFEIYCERSSIHGFHQFVGAKTWQRVLWWLFICLALLLSLLVLTMSYALTENTPTIRYIESMMLPNPKRPLQFPTVTVCSLNRVAKRSLSAKAKEWQIPEKDLQKLPWIATRRSGSIDQTILGRLNLVNLTWSQILEELSPKVCENQMLACQWKGRVQRCQELFSTTWSSTEGRCCSFTRPASCSKSSCNPAKGVSLRMATHLADYGSTSTAIAGFELLVHEAGTAINAATQRILLPRGTESHHLLRPFTTHATSHVAKLKVARRRCYLKHERKLFHFSNYSQDNCLAECSSAHIYQICGCVQPHMPRRTAWPICNVDEFQCLLDNDLDWDELQARCNCLPPCQFQRYELHSDVVEMDSRYAVPNTNDDNNFNGSDELVLHISLDFLGVEQLRLEVFQNWLTFIGKYQCKCTFGGITGLFMGCSFVSVFELIFFVCVRPTCNWLTRQQIRYRQRRRRHVQIEASQRN
ncbi:hypothetical protein KR222_008685 [Zaprionus bogoriensis]|nr:hypothetical protein KR222_008685 [Zaprionus bogoriensis]